MAIWSTTTWVKAGVLLVSFALLFAFFLHNQHLYSFGSGDWSHAYFIPFISVYLLWQRRAEIAACRIEPFWPGLLPVLVGIPAYALFQVSALSNHMAQGWAAVLCIFGIVLLVCGPRLMKFAFLPIAFLVFGITISEKIMILVTFQLQLLASKGAWALLNIVGVSTDVFGNVLKVTDSAGMVHDLNVAQACSGMRMVIAFAALGVAVALAGVSFWWQRTALVLLALPVAILMNVLRVAVLGVATLYNPSLAAGQAHMLIGTLLLLPAFGLYMGIVWVLNKAVVEEGSSPQSKVAKKQVGKPEPRQSGAGARAVGVAWSALRQPSFVAAVMVLLVSAATLNGAVSAMGLYLKKLKIEAPGNRRVTAVPKETESYQQIGQDVVMSSEVVDELGTPNYVTRYYTLKNPGKDEKNPRLELHLAYYTGMIDTVPHVPERCMTGAGWQVVGSPAALPLKLAETGWRSDDDAVPAKLKGRVFTAPAQGEGAQSGSQSPRVRLPFDPRSLEMRTMEFSGPRGSRMLAGYFFIANGEHTPSAEGVRSKAFSLTDDYAYYLKVQVASSDVTEAAELARHASRLLGELLPEIMRSVPDWVEVQEGHYPPDNPRRKK